MDLDILDMVCQRDSEAEDSDGEDDSGLAPLPSSSLEVLRGRVEENLKLLCTSSPIDASPLILSDLREKFPQVINIICNFISCHVDCSVYFRFVEIFFLAS